MRKLFVILAAVAFVVACSMPAMAAEKEVSFYGSTYLDTFWIKNSQELTGTGHDDSDLEWGFDNGARSGVRFGARFKSGDVGGHIEIRARQRTDSGARAHEFVRHWYGTWNFGPGTLVVGQTWAPTFSAVSNSMHETGNSLLFGDCISACRVPGIQLWFPLEFGTLKLAGLELQGYAAGTAVPGAVDIDLTLPKLELAFDFNKLGPVALKVFGGWQSWAEVTAADKEYDIDAWVYGLRAEANFGPAKVKGVIWNAQNIRQYNFDAAGGNPFNPILIGDNIEDVDTFGWFAAIAFKMNDMVEFEVGYGQVKSERANGAGVADDEDEDQMWNLMATIQLAKNVYLYPEIAKYDYKDRVTRGVSSEEGDTMAYGVGWMIKF
jgi:hypothetical protein